MEETETIRERLINEVPSDRLLEKWFIEGRETNAGQDPLALDIAEVVCQIFVDGFWEASVSLQRQGWEFRARIREMPAFSTMSI